LKKFILNLFLFGFVFATIFFFVSFLNHEEQIEEQALNVPPSINRVASATPIEILPTVEILAEPEKTEVSLLFGGDTMLARTIGDKILKLESPFANVQETFHTYDYVLLNLECVIAQQGKQASGKLYTFRGPVEAAAMMQLAGVDIVSTANNHSMDYGSEAFLQMLELLEINNITQIGGGLDIDAAYKPLIIDKNGNRIALFGFNSIENNFTDATEGKAGSASLRNTLKVVEAIQEIDQSVDLVIPFVHWGTEYQTMHSIEQENLAQLMVDAGADLIVGTHPHVRQDVGEYNGTKIYYSLGNFVFDQMPQRSDSADQADMLEVIIKNRELTSTRLLPIELDQQGLPHLN
jgi:poly-gamma-glutamate capsule biosynthesis protein CapA/YwtB (metallophosphatase superfamily)